MIRRAVLGLLAALSLGGEAQAQSQITFGQLPAVSSPSLTDTYPTTSGYTTPGTGATMKTSYSQILGALQGTGLTVSGTSLGVAYGATAGTAAQGNDSRIIGAAQTTGAVFTGPLTLAGSPTSSLQAATKGYVDASVASALPLAGGTLTGTLTLAGSPTATLQAATKGYVDTSVASYLPLVGGTVSGGALNINQTQTASPFSYYPLSLLFWNQYSGFSGPYNGNYQQYAPLTSRGISGPTSSGNTSALLTVMDSYGNNNVNSYDVGVFFYSNKYGQNSNWGLVDQMYDWTGRPPQAFASWNEYDIAAYGYDVNPWSPSYGSPQAAQRVGAYYNFGTFTQAIAWPASTVVNAPPTAQGSLTRATVIKVTVGGVAYTWYPAVGGTTGSTTPSFPAPAEFTASAASGTMTVSSVVPGTPAIATNDYISGTGFVTSAYITQQLSGTPGGVGTYALSSPITFGSTGVYGAPQVTEVGGTGVVWQFGANWAATVSTGIWFTGTAQIGTLLGSNSTIYNAAIDTSLATLASGAAAIRMASGQPIDFTGTGAVAGQNQHTLEYVGYLGSGLSYLVQGSTVFNVTDAGDTYMVGNALIGFGTQGLLTAGTSVVPNTSGLYVGRNAATFNEVDMVATNGLWAYGVTGSVVNSLPYFHVDSGGNMGVTGAANVGGVLTVTGSAVFDAAAQAAGQVLLNYGSSVGSCAGVTSVSNTYGLTACANLLGNFEEDFVTPSGQGAGIGGLALFTSNYAHTISAQYFYVDQTGLLHTPIMFGSSESHHRQAVADANYTLTATDFEVAFTSLTASRQVTLGNSVGTAAEPQYYVVKDESGQAATHPITFSANIDGSAKTISTAYGDLKIYWNGSAWSTW